MTAMLEYVDVPTSDGTADAVYARPAGEGAWPPVLFLTDAFGIRESVEAMVTRLADHGFCVLAPNLFYRAGRAPQPVDLYDLMRAPDQSALWEHLEPLMAQLTPDNTRTDTRAFLDWLVARGEALVETGAGVVGYCMGGRLALLAAGEHDEDVAAAASIHGSNLATTNADSPHLTAVKTRAELYIAHADNDASAPPEQIGRLASALAAAHVRHSSELYVGAKHGWTQSDRPAYDAAADERHWARIVDLFSRTLS